LPFSIAHAFYQTIIQSILRSMCSFQLWNTLCGGFSCVACQIRTQSRRNYIIEPGTWEFKVLNTLLLVTALLRETKDTIIWIVHRGDFHKWYVFTYTTSSSQSHEPPSPPSFTRENSRHSTFTEMTHTRKEINLYILFWWLLPVWCKYN